MRVVSITEMRQAGARLVREAQAADEPTLIVVHAQPAAYLVGIAQYDALRAEAQRLRREALEREVEIAMEEVRRGEYRTFDSVEELIADLHSEDEETECGYAGRPDSVSVPEAISSQQAAVESALRRFAADPADPRLRLYKLSGALDGQWALSAGHDLRIVCLIERDDALRVTGGDHDQVY